MENGTETGTGMETAGSPDAEGAQDLRGQIERAGEKWRAERSKPGNGGDGAAGELWRRADVFRYGLAKFRREHGRTLLDGEEAHFPDHLAADANSWEPDAEAVSCPECGAMAGPGENCWHCPREAPRSGLVLVCGGREFNDYPAVRALLDGIAPGGIVHGAARGADTLAGRYARDRALPCREFPVDWYPEGKFDRGAAFDRNRRMLLTSRPDLVVAFPGRGGTAHMVQTAREHGYPVTLAGETRRTPQK